MQGAVQAAETSEVVASVADAATSVCVLAEHAFPGDAAEGIAYFAALPLLLWQCPASRVEGDRHAMWVALQSVSVFSANSCFRIIFPGATVDTYHASVFWCSGHS